MRSGIRRSVLLLSLLGLNVVGAWAAVGPSISSIANGSSFALPPLAPGSLASLFGANLAPSSVAASGLPLPTTLNSVTLTVNGVKAPLEFVSASQINFQIPYETPTSGTVPVIVNYGTASNTFQLSMTAAAPGINTTNGAGTGQGVIVNQNGSSNSSTNPAPAGTTVSIYFTGVGAASPAVADGAAAPASPLSFPTITPTVTVNGAAAAVPFVGLAPGEVGSAQMNFTIPPSLAAGTYNVVITSNAVASNTVTITVGVPLPVSITASANGLFSMGDQQIPLTTSGGNGTYAWSLIAGSLPTGLALRTDVPSFFPANAAAGLIGVASTPGTYNFTLQVSSNGTAVSQAFTYKISALNVKDDRTLPDAFANNNYSYTFTALNPANGANPTFAVANGSNLPPGLNLSAAGVLSGMPSTPGQYNFAITVTDGVDIIQLPFNLFVSTIDVTSPGQLPNGTQGSTYNQSLTATGGSGAISWTTCCNLPPGLSLSSTGAFSGTITGGPGNYNFQVTASDTANHFYTKQMAINVAGTTPTLNRISLGEIDDAVVGDSYSSSIGLCCGGTAPFTWSATGLPAGMSIRSGSGTTSSYVGAGFGEIWGVASQTGSFPVTLTVTDANNVSNSINFTFHVSALDVNPGLPNGAINTAYSSNLRVLGGTAPYAASLAAGSNLLPDGIAVTSPAPQVGALVSGTPLENGGFNPTFAISDSGGNTLQRTVGFNIGGGNGNVINIGGNGNLGTFPLNGNYYNQLGACCVASYIWSVVSGTLPPGITLSNSGLLSGTPNTLGTYTFLLKAADAANVATPGFRQFTLSISAGAPFSGGLPTGNVGTAYSASIFGSSATPNGSTTALSPNNFLPPGLTLAANGTIGGMPTSAGQYFFQVSVSSPTINPPALAGFTLTILPANINPTLQITNNPNLGTWTLGTTEIAFNATGGSGNYVWSTTGSLPPGLTFGGLPTPPQSGIVGVATTPGNYSFTVNVSSPGAGLTPTSDAQPRNSTGAALPRAQGPSQMTSQTFSMRITALTAKDDYTLPPGFVGTNYSYQFTALNNAGAVTFTSTNALPGTMTLSSTGLLSGSAPAGNYNINFSIYDGTDTIFRGYQLTVYAVNITTAGVLPNATQGSQYNQTVVASGGSGAYTFSTGGLPGGLSMSSTGVISGTINAGPSKYNFTVTATDTNNASYSKQMSITVIGNPPALARLSPYSQTGRWDDAVVGDQYNNGISVCCGGTGPFTWSATGLPAGMSMRSGTGNEASYIGAGDAEIWGTATTPGNYNVTVTATDKNGATVSNTFPFRVSVLDIEPYLPNGTLGTPYSATQLILGGSPVFSPTQVVTGSAPPDGLTLTTGSTTVNNVTGLPLESGNFNYVFQATDGNGNTLLRTNYFQINNSAAGGININNNGNLGQIELGNYNFQLSACCVNSYVWSVVSGTLPPNITLSAGGLLSGSATTAGTYTFLVKAADAANVAAPGFRQFTLVVTPINITTNGLTYGSIGVAYSASLAATGGSGMLTWTVAPNNFLPPGITLNGNGTFTGMPTATGQFGFNVTVTDANNNTATRFYSISVYNGAPPVTIGNGPNFGTAHLGSNWYSLSASGGNGTYTWSLVSGTLPTGLALRTDVPSFFASNQQAGLIGVATTTGTYNFTLMVSSGGQNASQAFTMKISALDLQDATPPDGFVGQPFTYTFTPIANAGPVTFTVNSNSTNGVLPPGLTLSSAGVLAGTPTTAGVYTIAMNINDGVDTQYEQYTLNVYAVDIGTAGLLPNGTQNTAYSTTLSASGGAGNYTWTSTGLPSGLTLSSTGTLSGTITAGPNLYGFAVTATDSNKVSYSKNMALDVVASPVAPMRITGTIFNDPVLGNHYGAVQGVCCGGTAPFTWTVTGLPPGLTTEANSNSFLQYPATPGNLQIYGVPQQAGTFNVVYKVTDATGASTSLTVPMHVSDLDVSLTSYSAFNLPNGTINVPYSATFRVLGGTGPYSFTRTVYGELPDGLSITSNNLTVSGTPLENGNFNAPGFQFADSAGNTLFRYESIQIGGGTSTIAINNNGIDGYNLGTASVGVPYSTQFSACCAPNYTWSVASGSNLPAGLSLSASGQLSGTPTTAGTYNFLIDSANGMNVGVRNFTLVVTPISITNASLPYGIVGAPYNASLTTSGASGAVTWTLAYGSLLPPGVTLTGNGILGGTPNSAGAYSVTFQGTDTQNNIILVGYTIDVYVNSPPLNLPIGPNIGTYLIGALRYQLSATGGVPPYHYAYTPGAMPIPGFRVQDGQPLPTNFPSTVTGGLLGVFTATGNYATSIRVTDSTGTTFDRAITLTVSSVDLLTATSPPKGVAGTNYSFQFTPYGGSGNYTWSASGLNGSGLSIGSTTGLLSGANPVAGTYNATITLADAAGGPGFNFNFTITINPFAITDSPILPQGAEGTAYSHQFSAPGCGNNCAWSVTSGSPPSGISLSSGGLLQGTYTGLPGYYNFFTVQASGTAGTVQKVFTLNITPGATVGLSITTSITTTTVVAGQPLTTLNATGGTPPYSWSVSAGNLPMGISLLGPGETIGATTGPGFYYLAGRAVQAGTYNFTLQVKDTLNNTATKAFSWIVSPMNIDYTSLPNSGTPLILNQAYTQPMLVIGGSGTYTTFATAAPVYPGLSVNSGTGVITGSPTNTGSISTLWTVTDSSGNTAISNVSINASSTASVEVTINGGPGVGAVAALGASPSYTLTGSGGTAPYAITAPAGLPASFALVPLASGAYQLYFSPEAAGTYTFTLQATDANGAVGAKTYSVIVPGFSAPTTNALATGSVGVAYSQVITAYAAGGGSPTWSITTGSALPPGLMLSAGGVLSGTPTTAGFYQFSATLTDTGNNSSSFTFLVAISNLAITTPLMLPNAIAGVSYTTANPLVTMAATGGAGKLTWSATGLPQGLTMSSSGAITGTASNAPSRSTGLITATDGVSSIVQTYVLFTEFPNPSELDYPNNQTALPNAVMGREYQYSLVPDGGVPPYTWALAAGSSLPPGLYLASGATVLPNSAPGITQLLGSPTTAGQYSFSLTASDFTGAQVTRTFTLNVTPVGLISASPSSALVGSAYSFQLIAFGGTSPYTFAMAPNTLNQDVLPPGITFSATGLFSGTPTATGSFSSLLTVTDAAGKTYTAALTFIATNANGLYVTSGNAALLAGQSMTNYGLSTSGSSTYTWSLTSGNLPPGVTLQSAGYFSGWPSLAGVYQFTVRATDNSNAANFAERFVTFRVTPMQLVLPQSSVFSSAILPSGAIGTAYSYQLQMAGGTPPYTFSESPFLPLPPGIAMSSSGLLSGTPTQSGAFTVRPVVTDSTGLKYFISSLPLVITPAGGKPPLQFGNGIEGPNEPSVGVPYASQLDRFLTGGTPPYSWTVTSGSLPPGITIINGANGVPTFLNGIPAAAGNYNFTLSVTDAGGQTVSTQATIPVSPLSLSPSGSLPLGSTASNYSVTFTAAGGTSPYNLQVDPSSNLPPGLNLVNGVLSGTPLYPGVFYLILDLTDSANNSLQQSYDLVIDDALGEAPGIALSPNPINIYYVQGNANPAIPLTVTSSSGSLAFTAGVAGITGATLSSTSGTTNGSTTLNLPAATLALGTYSGVVAAHSAAAVNSGDAIPVTLTVAAPPPCTYSLNPSSNSIPIGGGTGTFTIATGPTCAWSATVSGPVTIAGASSGTGQAIVTYTVPANTGINQVNGSITIGGQTYSITQFGQSCSFAIVPSSFNTVASGGQAPISVIASNASCAWMASGLGVTPASGTGSGTVNVTIPANTAAVTQNLSATIAGQTLSVTQTGVQCQVTLPGTSASALVSGGQGSVAVTIPNGCSYTTVSGPGWISINSGGSGNASGTLVYTVAPNSTTMSRSGFLTIGGVSYQITQPGIACSITLDSSGLGSPFAQTGGTGTININANGNNCPWTASSGNAFATVTPASGTGSGSVSVTVAANAGVSTLNGSVTIAGQTVNFMQGGTVCSYMLQSPGASVPASGGSGIVGVVAPAACTWSASTNNPAWLTILSSGTGGTANVQFLAQPNNSGAPQSGSLTIAGLTFNVTQAAAPCSYSLSSPSANVASAGITNASLTVSTTQNGCNAGGAVVTSYANWITASNSAGTVTYSVLANASGATRQGTVQIGDQVFTVTETGAACSYSLAAYGAAFGQLGGGGNVLGSPNAQGCIPSVGTGQPAIVTLGAVSPPVPPSIIFTQPYTVNTFNSLTNAIRRLTITFGGQIYTIKQTSW